MKLPQKIFLLYCLLISLFVFLTSLVLATNLPSYLSAAIFSPVVIYFGIKLFSSSQNKIEAKWPHILIGLIILLVLSVLAILNIQKAPTQEAQKSEPLIFNKNND